VNDELERFWMKAATIRHLPEGNDVSILSSFLSHSVRIRLTRVETSLQFISVSVAASTGMHARTRGDHSVACTTEEHKPREAIIFNFMKYLPTWGPR